MNSAVRTLRDLFRAGVSSVRLNASAVVATSLFVGITGFYLTLPATTNTRIWEELVAPAVSFDATRGLPDAIRQPLNHRLHDFRLRTDADYRFRIAQVGETRAVHKEAVGDGAAALDACYDMILAGPNGILDDGDEWELHTTELNYNSTGDGSLQAWWSDTIQTGRVNVGAFTAGGESDSGPSGETDGECVYLTGKMAQGGGAQVEANGRWRIGESGDWSKVYIGYMRIYLKTGGILFEGLDSAYFEHISAGMGGEIGGHAVGIDISGDTTSGNNDHARWISDIYGFRWGGNPRNSAYGGCCPRDQPATNHITIARSGFWGPSHRVPLLGGDTMTVVQGVTYNPVIRPLESGNQVDMDLIGWTFKRGPGGLTGGVTSETFLLVGDEQGFGSDMTIRNYVSRIIFDAMGVDETIHPDSLYADGGTYQIIFCRDIGSGSDSCATTGDPVPDSLMKSSPRSLHPDFPVDTAWNDSLTTVVKDRMGYSFRLDSLGDLEDVRSTDGTYSDSARIQQFDDSTGHTDEIDGDTVNIPTPSTGTACRDGDGDLMCDAWEEANGLDSSDGSDGSEDPDGDGVPNLFEWFGTPSSGSTDPQASDQTWVGITATASGGGGGGSTVTMGSGSSARSMYRCPGLYQLTGGLDSAGDSLSTADSTRFCNRDTLASIDPDGYVLIPLGGGGAGSGDSLYLIVTADTPGTSPLDSQTVADTYCTPTGECDISTLLSTPLPDPN